MLEPRVISENEKSLSQWVTLVARTIEDSSGQPQTYHSFKLADYVAILAVTDDGRIPCVRQYRPARKAVTLEFPAGILEAGENPAETAARELFEETGYRTRGKPTLLAKLNADTGRLCNDLWCFFADGVSLDSTWKKEDSVDRVLYTKPELKTALAEGVFCNAMHLALVSQVLLRGKLPLEDLA